MFVPTITQFESTRYAIQIFVGTVHAVGDYGIQNFHVKHATSQT